MNRCWNVGLKAFRVSLFATVVFVVMPRLGAAAWSPDMSEIIARAKKEGQVNLVWGAGTLGGSEGARRFQDALNKMFGTDLRVRFSPGPSMPALGSQIATEHAAGQPAVTDVYIGAGSYRGPLVQRGIFHRVDWPRLLPQRITAEMVEGNSTSLRILSGLPGVPHNTRLVPKDKLPRTLVEFLNPEWKGKIASTPYAASLEMLAAPEMWGPEKALDYVRKLSGQIAGLIRCNETERLLTGEFLALVMDCNGADTFKLQAEGAPVDLMVPVDGAQIRYFYLSIPKNARNPNAAKLFTTFLMTEEGQKIMWDTSFSDLHFFPNSQIRKRMLPLEQQGVKFLEATIDFGLKHPEIEKVRAEMSRILSRK